MRVAQTPAPSSHTEHHSPVIMNCRIEEFRGRSDGWSFYRNLGNIPEKGHRKIGEKIFSLKKHQHFFLVLD